MLNNLTREEYLTEASNLILEDIFSEYLPDDFEYPRFRISIGFLSNKASKAIAVCYVKEASSDLTNEIFVTPTLDDTFKILGALTHELVHALDNCKSGHKNFFAMFARQIGLEGRLTATVPGEQLTTRLHEIASLLGDIPHAALNLNIAKKKQTTRMKKVECTTCGFSFRTSQKNIDNIDFNNTSCPACNSHITLTLSA